MALLFFLFSPLHSDSYVFVVISAGSYSWKTAIRAWMYSYSHFDLKSQAFWLQIRGMPYLLQKKAWPACVFSTHLLNNSESFVQRVSEPLLYRTRLWLLLYYGKYLMKKFFLSPFHYLFGTTLQDFWICLMCPVVRRKQLFSLQKQLPRTLFVPLCLPPLKKRACSLKQLVLSLSTLEVSRNSYPSTILGFDFFSIQTVRVEYRKTSGSYHCGTPWKPCSFKLEGLKVVAVLCSAGPVFVSKAIKFPAFLSFGHWMGLNLSSLGCSEVATTFMLLRWIHDRKDVLLTFSVPLLTTDFFFPSLPPRWGKRGAQP